MIALLLSLLLTPQAHAGKRPQTPAVVEDALAFATTDRTKAVTLLEDALEAGTKPKDLAVVALHAGEQRRLSGDADAAKAWFEQSLEAGSEGEWADAARLGLVLTKAKSGLDAAAVADLKRINEKTVLDTQNADRFLFLTIDATRNSEVGKVNQYSKRALIYAKADPAVQTRVKAALEKLASGGPVQVANDDDAKLLDRARKALESGDRARAAELARQAESEAAPDSFEHLQAAYMVRRAEATAVVNPDLIAVLLPMSDKYEAVGRQVKEAFEFGYRAGGGTRKLRFVDTGATPEGAVAALETAVLQDGAVGVVGPLLSEATEQVVDAAAALEVPLVSLSQSNERDDLDWVFQGVPSIGDQADALAEFAMVREQMKAFAIFAPQTAYGERAAKEFRDAVEARGGTITVETYYDPAAPALMEFASKLGRKDYEARKWEFHKLKEEIEEKGGNPANAVLPPKIDFDGLFLPDNARKIPIACAALAYEEFPIGEFKPKRNQDPVPVLGLSGWNSPDLVAAGGEYVRGSRFTDAFFVDASDAFVAAYKADLQRTPSSLEAVAVDAGRLLGAATRGSIATRADLRQALLDVQISGAPTGATGFDADKRRVRSRIRILSIDRNSIVPVDAEPATP
ncbi:MAG: penicillin-binding protein activator [Alphaproteobacteria bacterium]|nr:penicillin-binding protein activator [Alphaproteobacteria bacterium]